jgi:hypothetical protein
MSEMKKIGFEPSISTGQMCKSYYESELYNADPEFECAVYFEILKVDSPAKEICIDTLARELRGLNIELFGLAWFDHNYGLFEQEKLESNHLDTQVLTEIWFTKFYLEHFKENETWNAMGFYNDVIMQAAIAQKALMDWSIPRDVPGYHERGCRPSAEKLEKEQWEHVREYFGKKLDDEECCIRLTNRFISAGCWQDGILISQKLTYAFAQRLGFNPNLEAFLLLQRIIVGLYDNAVSLIVAAEEYGSYELARKKAFDLREHLIKVIQKDMEEQNKIDG